MQIKVIPKEREDGFRPATHYVELGQDEKIDVGAIASLARRSGAVIPITVLTGSESFVVCLPGVARCSNYTAIELRDEEIVKNEEADSIEP